MGLRDSLGGIASGLAGLAGTRLELFGLELAEEKSRLCRAAAMALAATICLILALLVFSLLVAALFWPTEHRYVALGVLAAVYAVAGLALLAGARRALKSGPPFAATLEELRRDAEMFSEVKGLSADEPAAPARTGEGPASASRPAARREARP